MPTPADIVAGLTAIANDRFAAAIAWHVVLLAALVGFWLGWRPSRVIAALLLATLPASVSAFAFGYGNPFNGILFGLLAALVVLTAPATRPMNGRTPMTFWLGAGMVAFGWVYPHFLEGKPLIAYAAGAPTGLIPCPTLAVMTGVTLLKGDLFSRRWALTLAVFGLFYSAFGVLRLGVWLDVVLLAGAIGLLLAAWPGGSRRSI